MYTNRKNLLEPNQLFTKSNPKNDINVSFFVDF